MCMHSEIRQKLCKSYLVSFGLVNISLGLLRSGDYDTILAALSLLTSLLTVKEISEFIEYNGIRMISKLLQQKEVEYIYFILQLIDLILNSSRENRNQILHIGLADALKYNIKNNAELQKCPRLFGQAKRIKDEIEVFESVVANMNASYLLSG
ncbi:unnamed protein product [Blepharisma stoltei]|uniref:Uncharacterized protein n=1 Tax=Blepharisma stoltei TaxID=1481888 RepID=A0AAU9JBZ2_9CILI|nr:unnamed protein product [Blepharisma stoltei]